MGLDLSKIVPDKKDLMRARELSQRGRTFYGNGAPFESKATSMAKLITDRMKLIRRAKAVAAIWGIRDHFGYSAGKPIKENPWNPFAIRLQEFGFTYMEIKEISEYEHPDPIEQLGLEDMF